MKKVIVRVLGVLFVMAFVCFAANVSAQITQKADAKFNKCEYPQALKMYKKILNTSNLNIATKSEVCTKIAKCYIAMGFFTPAKQWIEKVMQLNPDYIANYPLYSEVLRNNGYYMEALSYYYRYSAEIDDSVKYMKNRSMLLYPVGNNFTNPFVTVSGQYVINTFGKKRGLQYFGGKLYYSTTGYMLDPEASDYDAHIYDYHMFKSDIGTNGLKNSIPVTDMPVFVRNRVVSFAKYPQTDDIYFVALNKKGEPTLYCSQFTDSVYSKKKEVRIGGKALPVESLTFTPDGRKMIFSAYLEDNKGRGNNDLWMSELVGKDWQAPVNLGPEINTRGDEITPYVSGNTLFFSSNGQVENFGGFDIYSVTLDGPKSEVCNLKMPYNSFADDFSFVLSPEGKGGFLVSTRDTTMLDDKIYNFSAAPNFTLRKGFMYDKSGRPLEDVNITLVEANTDKVLCITKSGKSGKYGFFMHNEKSYRIELEKENFFPLKIESNQLLKRHSGYFNPTKQENIILDGFELNKAYKMEGIFHQTADVEVQNTLRLSTVATFLKNNANLVLYVHLFGYISSEEDFNEILNKKRVSNLVAYMQAHGVSSSRVKYETYENMLPVDFPDVDIKKDKTYVLYFVVCPQKTRPLLPKTKNYRRM